MRRRTVNLRGGRGFTLIEALAAIAVMVIIIPVLLQGFSIAGRIAENTRQKADATALAQSTMDELIATQEWQNGGGSGETDIGPTHYGWTAELNDYQAEVNVQTLTVSVTWETRGVPNEIKVVTLVYMPGSTIQTDGTTGGTTPLGGLLP